MMVLGPFSLLLSSSLIMTSPYSFHTVQTHQDISMNTPSVAWRAWGGGGLFCFSLQNCVLDVYVRIERVLCEYVVSGS